MANNNDASAVSADKLVWSPVWDEIRFFFSNRDSDLSLIVAPFIQLAALREVLSAVGEKEGLQIITRWRKQDVTSGVSDIEIFPFLRELGIKLYTNERLHMKLFACRSGTAIITSANVTGAGLGLSPRGNLEVATKAQLSQDDWDHLAVLLASCREITQADYEIVRAYVKANQSQTPSLPPWELPSRVRASFSILDLPATNAPTDFLSDYLDGARRHNMAVLHDTKLFGLTPGLSRQDAMGALSQNLTKLAFVQSAISELKKNGSMSFGQMTAWIHRNCTDDPAPYRKDVKVLTENLFNWLEQLIPEVSSDVPNHSRILRWSK